MGFRAEGFDGRMKKKMRERVFVKKEKWEWLILISDEGRKTTECAGRKKKMVGVEGNR